VLKMKIFLIRHGESIQNTNENVDNLPDHAIHLTERGKAQADAAGAFLKTYIEENQIDLSKARLWISPYRRTRETAALVNAPIGIDNTLEDFRLVEQQFGLFDGVLDEEIPIKYPNEHAFFERTRQFQGKFYARYPQGESAFDVAIRVKSFIGSMVRDYEKQGLENLFIVSHGLTNRILIQSWLKHAPEWLDSERNPKNCSVRLIEDREDKGYLFIPNV
jgi:2,3-bisphosphoglycerate-dependent phosphoglycerate mutase